MRRVFYPAGPSDVVFGFLSFLLGGAVVGLLGYGLVYGHVGSAGYALIKVLPFALLGLGRMLYRERVVMDLRQRTVTAETWFFLLPLSRATFGFKAIASLSWSRRPTGGGWELDLRRDDGTRHLLARARTPDEALVSELRSLLELA